MLYIGVLVIKKGLPWFIDTYSIKLNITVKNLNNAKGIIVIIDINMDDVIKGISAARFRNGGAPIFVAIIKNQKIEIEGVTIRIPLLIIIARELDIS